MIEAGMDWNSYEQHLSFWDRPPREAFIKFVAKRLKGKLASGPIGISLGIDRSSNGHLYLTGTIRRGSETDRLWGEAVWMPKLKSFRGHLLINPPSAEEIEHEEIEHLRRSEWHLEKWRTNGKPEHTHDHCGICWHTLYETENQAEGFGYTNGSDWVCQNCYTEHIQ